MRILLTLALLTASCFGQLSPYVQAGISSIQNMGYQNPDWAATAGARYLAPRWEAETQFQFDSAHKYIGDGHSLSAQGAVYGCLSRTCLGGGAQWGEESTSQWTKTSWRPLLMVRQHVDALTLTAYLNPTSGTDKQNHEHAFGLTAEYALTRHWTWIGDLTFAVFQPTNQPKAGWLVGQEYATALRY